MHHNDIKRTRHKENLLIGAKNRILQHIARFAPGGMKLRVLLHRWRGVTIGSDVWIGYDSILETSYPHFISIGNRVTISVRAMIIAHYHELRGVNIEDDVFIGPGVIILPNVTIGQGSVVSAGSVVTTSVPAMSMVQGNPARPIAKCGVPLGINTPIKEFLIHLRPLQQKRAGKGSAVSGAAPKNG
jgi:acetyltransferase-like isoleucine patch superfamily enzyme